MKKALSDSRVLSRAEGTEKLRVPTADVIAYEVSGMSRGAAGF
jgi:hypothetical protein